jgi:hypothetical protein
MIRGVLRLKLPSPLDFFGVEVRDDLTGECVALGDVDHTPVGQIRHQEPGDAIENEVGVERLGERGAGAQQQLDSEPLLISSVRCAGRRSASVLDPPQEEPPTLVG